MKLNLAIAALETRIEVLTIWLEKYEIMKCKPDYKPSTVISLMAEGKEDTVKQCEEAIKILKKHDGRYSETTDN